MSCCDTTSGDPVLTAARGWGMSAGGVHTVSPGDGPELAVLRRVFAETPDAVGVSVGTEIRFANAALLAMLGVADEAAIVGRPFPELLSPRVRAQVLEQVGRRTAGAPVMGSYAVELVRADGEVVAAELRTTTLAVDGATGWIALFRPALPGPADALYRAVFESNTAIKLLVDPDTGQVVDANAAAVRFYGWPLPELRGMQLHRINLLDPEEIRSRMERVISGEQRWFRFRHRIASGDVRHVKVHSVPIEIGGRVHLLSIVQDVTDRVTLEERLREAQRLEAVGLVAGSVGHDLANLHTILLGCADALSRTLPPGSEGQQPLQELLHAVRRAGDLTRRLIEAGGAPRERGPCRDVSELVLQARSLLEAAAGPRVTLHLVGARGAWAWIDEDDLERVLVNLVLNAREAGATQVDVAVAAVGRTVSVTVRDDGPGMDPATAERAFDPFFTTKGATPGRGLGLASVRSVLHGFGGHVTVASEAGRGATFRITLPRTPDAGLVLLVDDEADVRDVLAQSLALDGFAVRACASVEEALALPPEVLGAVRLLVTDQRMPGRSGTELAAELTARDPTLRVVVISGDLSAGPGSSWPPTWRFLRKPFTGRELTRALRDAQDASARAPDRARG